MEDNYEFLGAKAPLEIVSVRQSVMKKFEHLAISTGVAICCKKYQVYKVYQV